MCYRDRTYCDAECSTRDCSRRVTPEVEAAAQRAGLWLAVSNLRTDCDRYAPVPAASDEERAER